MTHDTPLLIIYSKWEWAGWIIVDSFTWFVLKLEKSIVHMSGKQWRENKTYVATRCQAEWFTLDESSPKQSAKRSGLVPWIEAQSRDTTGWICKEKPSLQSNLRMEVKNDHNCLTWEFAKENKTCCDK